MDEIAALYTQLIGVFMKKAFIGPGVNDSGFGIGPHNNENPMAWHLGFARRVNINYIIHNYVSGVYNKGIRLF